MTSEVNPVFPAIYAAHHRLHQEDMPFWQDLANFYGDPILELGCGTGRVLLSLAQAGRRVYGIDIDPGMLALLKHHLPPALESSVAILQADMRDFCLEMHFPLIILPCNTYSTLSAGDRQRALRQVRRHLQTDGVFAVSVPNPALLKQLPARSAAELEEIFDHPVTGNPVQVSSGWKRSQTYFTYEWHYDHLLPDGRVERYSVQIRHELTTLEIYRQELVEAGFTLIGEYGDFDYSAYQEESPALIMLAAG